jgi:hypothetical protein
MPKSNSNKRTIGHANFASNRIRRIKAEAKRCEKKMNKLLRLYEEERPRNCGDKVRKTQGMAPDSQRHKKLKAYIASLRGKVQ